MDRRARARDLAAEYLAKGDPMGWFEHLYREAEEGKSSIPWADHRPNPNLVKFWKQHSISSSGKTALTIGCGLGDDAEQLSAWGFQTTAFDISDSAIRTCRQRFPGSKVNYTTADLLNSPHQWIGRFDFVLESYTLQVLPPHLRGRAIECMADVVCERGHLLIITRGRESRDAEGQMPWPLTRSELDGVTNSGLQELLFADFFDCELPPVRRFIGLYKKARSKR
ncbi:MAG: class I SAM-dependent methyltransferase [Bryobacteraceae bacterium]